MNDGLVRSRLIMFLVRLGVGNYRYHKVSAVASMLGVSTMPAGAIPLTVVDTALHFLVPVRKGE